jgi:hypothetical protein
MIGANMRIIASTCSSDFMFSSFLSLYCAHNLVNENKYVIFANLESNFELLPYPNLLECEEFVGDEGEGDEDEKE